MFAKAATLTDKSQKQRHLSLFKIVVTFLNDIGMLGISYVIEKHLSRETFFPFLYSFMSSRSIYGQNYCIEDYVSLSYKWGVKVTNCYVYADKGL